MAGSFAAQLTAFASATRERADNVFRTSATRVIADMQTEVSAGGNMPVDTGFLRASLQVDKDAPAPINGTAPDKTAAYAYDPSAATLTINDAGIGDQLFACYTANYAPMVEYGARGRAGRQFVGMAAQKWPAIVAQACVELQSGASSSPGGSTP